MPQEVDSTISALPSISYPWYEVWWRALIPRVETYQDLLLDPDFSRKRAYIWLFISLLISTLISMIGETVFETGNGEVEIWLFLCGPITITILALAAIIISTAITQWIARLLGGTGTYTDLIYAVASYLSPLLLIASLINLLPYGECLSLFLGLYRYAQEITVIKAVNRFSWAKAFTTMIIPGFILIALIIGLFVLTRLI